MGDNKQTSRQVTMSAHLRPQTLMAVGADQVLSDMIFELDRAIHSSGTAQQRLRRYVEVIFDFAKEARERANKLVDEDLKAGSAAQPPT